MSQNRDVRNKKTLCQDAISSKREKLRIDFLILWSRKGRYRGYHNKKSNIGDKGKEVLENMDENNPVIKQFQGYAAELNDKHDRFEKIVKIGRDITIESKRIIFLLHTIDKESKHETVLKEAKTRLDNLGLTLFKAIAHELDDQDSYQYLGAYRCSLEEYVEAVTFYQYLLDGNIQDWTELQKSLTYSVTDKPKQEENSTPQVKTICTLITPCKYILGIADLTGELMRKCINNLATGDIASCYETCNFVRNMYKGFLSCTNTSNKEINKKLDTLKQSLCKIENVCYTIKVRGSEIPKHKLIDLAADDYSESDEGYEAY